MNLVAGRLDAGAGGLAAVAGNARFVLPQPLAGAYAPQSCSAVTLGLRPEDFHLSAGDLKQPQSVPVTAVATEVLGPEVILVCELGGKGGPEIMVRCPRDFTAASGQQLTLHYDLSQIHLFDKITGKVRWQTGEDLASYASPVLAKIDNRDVVFVFARGGLLAIDPAEGKTLATFLWRSRMLESVNASTPAVVGDEIFISEAYEVGSALVRFKGNAFEEIWTDRNRPRARAPARRGSRYSARDEFRRGGDGAPH